MKRIAFAGLGLAFVILLVGTYLIVTPAYAPEEVSGINGTNTMMTLTSSAFNHGDVIPQRYTCDDENINPPLAITGVPEGTKELVLLMDDPDIPQSVKESMGIEKFDHWGLLHISPDTPAIETDSIPEGAVAIQNSKGEASYTGPCPPDGEHRYIFTLYSLDVVLELGKEATQDEVVHAMDGHILAEAELIGRYTRN